MFGAHFFGRHYWSKRFFGSGGVPVPLVFPTEPGQIIIVDALSAIFAVAALSSQFAVDDLNSIITVDDRSSQFIGG